MAPTFDVGSDYKGFRVQRSADVELMRSHAVELEHEASGARVLHVKNDDSENLFSVTFATLPADDTGVAHIVEHSVLAGSERYPHKDSFFELYRSSAATFINAMTAQEHTLYPVSSTVPRDLFILADVYFDCVFHPLLSEHTFRREGHRLELVPKDGEGSELVIKGIVYSEMRGAYSSIESLIHRERDRALFPDTLYGRDSGGDPEVIPELTYQGFRAFYERYYQPSNALIVLYGNIPTEQYLDFLAPRLNGLARRPRELAFPRQPRWTASRSKHMTHPESPARAGSAYLLLTWLAGDGMNPDDALGLYLLHVLLLGYEGAPLRKAILDSKIGEDLALSGADAHSLEATFSIGVKGSKAERADAFVKLVLDTLSALADRGFERSQIESAAQQLAYGSLEIGSGFPVELLWRLSSRYVLTGDFVDALRPAEHLASVRQRALDDSAFLPNLIRERLLDNQHRLLLVSEGDAEHAVKRDAAVAEALRVKKAALSPADENRLRSEAVAFEQQENQEPDKAAFGKLELLKPTDLPSKPRQIERQLESDGRLDFVHSNVFANGVNYLHLDFDLAHVPPARLPDVALYIDLLSKLGTSRHSYVEIGESIAAHTGGIYGWPYAQTYYTDPDKIVRRLRVVTKFLDGHAEPALALVEELLFELDGGNVERIREALIQARARQRSHVTHLAPQLVSSYAARGVSPESWLLNQLHGVPRVRRIEALTKAFESGDANVVDGLISELRSVAKLLRQTPRLSASFTGSNSERHQTKRRLVDWLSEPAAREQPEIAWEPRRAIERVSFVAPMDVAFCSFVLPSLHTSDPDAQALSVGARHLGLHWVLDEIRLKGAAYGAGCTASLANRAFQLSSYRDPNPARTLGIFESAASAIRDLEWTQADIDRTIITLAKDSVSPNRANEVTSTVLSWHVSGETDEVRSEHYRALLSVTAARAKASLLALLERGADRACACVAGGRSGLDKLNAELGDKALSVEELIA